MVLLPHGPEPCASANSAIPARHVVFYMIDGRKSSLLKIFFDNLKIFFDNFFLKIYLDFCGSKW